MRKVVVLVSLLILMIVPAFIGLSYTYDHQVNSYDTLQKRGCCSSHGGVCGCDRKSGKLRCCDGTLSPTCT